MKVFQCSDADLALLDEGKWLNDNIIHAAQTILARQFPKQAGFQYTQRFKSTEWPVASQGKGTIQIHNVTNCHWVTSTHSGGAIRVFDSLYGGELSDDFKKQLLCLYGEKKKKLQVQVVRVQQQQGTSDCGVYAVAYAVDIALGLDPVQVKYDQKLMRGHLRRCLSTGQFDRFPCEKRVCRAARPDTFTLTL